MEENMSFSNLRWMLQAQVNIDQAKNLSLNLKFDSIFLDKSFRLQVFTFDGT